MEGSGPEGMMFYRTEEEFLLVCGGSLRGPEGGSDWRPGTRGLGPREGV